MSDVRAYMNFIEAQGRSLNSPGLSEVALSRADALRAIDLLESASVPLLGGDVYVAKGDKIEIAYANWHTDQRGGETDGQFAMRTWRESRSYISRYPELDDGEPIFVLVPALD